MNEDYPPGFPILIAFPRNREGDLDAWCPHCKQWHHHGPGEGHRHAHCNRESPFREGGGYILKRIKLPRKAGVTR